MLENFVFLVIYDTCDVRLLVYWEFINSTLPSIVLESICDTQLFPFYSTFEHICLPGPQPHLQLKLFCLIKIKFPCLKFLVFNGKSNPKILRLTVRTRKLWNTFFSHCKQDIISKLYFRCIAILFRSILSAVIISPLLNNGGKPCIAFLGGSYLHSRGSWRQRVLSLAIQLNSHDKFLEMFYS